MSVDLVASNTHGNLDEQIAQLMQCKPLSEPEEYESSKAAMKLSEFVRCPVKVQRLMNLVRQKLDMTILKQLDTSLSNTKTLNKFLCVILGGLAAEQLVFGYSEGLHSDVEKLNRVLKWLGFTENEADCQVKWAAVNTLLILVRHQEARSRVAEAMALEKSVGSCIDIIENTLIDKEI
ncbi:Serine/threonine-protein phosphatase PP2A-5 catalytic subunit [Camellia lanceoleosa]|uniref:Serine/threonine-protein phosphatase PP2A-5 catalytic subunit n=1 Tax=Camellia lanceoleosa TaxID=1840588 RepID=A0ACC0HKU8_9ERIC|nr:Serine/threonine-protein phosphatase PP2A-5 catalytic subunit [Camellia lanceoleosa]